MRLKLKFKPFQFRNKIKLLATRYHQMNQSKLALASES